MTATIIIGLVLALLYAEITGILPGGIIVPAFLAVSLDRPARVLTTVLAAFLCVLCYRLLSRYFLLFGRRRFVLMILLGALFGQIWSLVWPSLGGAPLDLRIVGWIIPGLLANNLVRQKFLPTLASLVTVTVLTYLISRIIGML
jgi:gamma-polyglutamate biosynthesis protein CapC